MREKGDTVKLYATEAKLEPGDVTFMFLWPNVVFSVS